MTNYTSTDQYLHVLSQILAKIGRSLVASKDDDSHTNLSFSAENKRIYTHWFVTPKGKFIAFIDLINQSFRLQGEVALKPIPWNDKTLFEIESELSAQLTRLGISIDSVFAPLHYDIPEYNTAKRLHNLNEDDINDWAAMRALANVASLNICRALNSTQEPRIWPHHFDTGIYVDTNKNAGIGFGLAMKDNITNAPYFYMSCYKTEGEVDFNTVPNLPYGDWNIDSNWNGAYLPINEFDLSTIKPIEILEQFSKAVLAFYLPVEATNEIA